MTNKAGTVLDYIFFFFSCTEPYISHKTVLSKYTIVAYPAALKSVVCSILQSMSNKGFVCPDLYVIVLSDN